MGASASLEIGSVITFGPLVPIDGAFVYQKPLWLLSEAWELYGRPLATLRPTPRREHASSYLAMPPVSATGQTFCASTEENEGASGGHAVSVGRIAQRRSIPNRRALLDGLHR